MRQTFSYGAAYALWLVTIAGAIVLGMSVRTTYQLALSQIGWDRYSVSAIERFATVFLALALVILFIYTEHFYRTGVAKQRLWLRFSRLISIGLQLFAVIQGLRVVLEWSSGFFSWFTFLLFVAATTAMILMRAVVRWLRQNQATSVPGVRISLRDAQMRRRPLATILGGAAVLLGLGLLFSMPLKSPLNIYDEGLALYNAERILAGDVPFRDFWALYPPGQSYTLAALFQIFDANVLVARLYDTAVRIAAVVAAFLLVDRLISRRWAWIVGSMTALLLAAATFYGYAMFPALLLALLSLLALTRYMNQQKGGWLAAGGIAVGLTAAFRLDVGFYTGISLVLGILFFDLQCAKQRFSALIAHLLLLVGGVLLVMVPFYGYLAFVGGPADLWADLVIFPVRLLPEARRLAYPSLLPDLSALMAGSIHPHYILNPIELWLLFYLPLLVYAVSLAVIAVRAWQHRHRTGTVLAADAGVLAIIVLGLGLFNQAMSRYDGIHVLPTSLFALMAAVWLLHSAASHLGRQPALLAAAIAALLFVAWPYVLSPAARLIALAAQFPATGCHAALEKAGCVYVAKAQQEAVAFVQANSSPREKIFVGAAKHDQVFVNDMSFYFLVDRPSATKFHEVHPGLTDTLAAQEAIVSDIRGADVDWLVTLDWPDSQEPNRSAVSSGIHHLDEFIAANYRRVNQFERYSIWRQRSNLSTGYFVFFIIGSSASRRPSPIKYRASTVSVIRTPGAISRCRAT